MARHSLYSFAVLDVAFCVLALVAAQYDPASSKGTTVNIEEVFVGRCWDYDVTKYMGELPRVRTDCDDLWKKFFEAFSYMPPCAVNMSNYEPFLDAAKQTLPKDKVMLWSGTYSLAHRFSETGTTGFFTLEDSLVGYLANDLTWCGQSTDPGMNFTRCPSWNDCPLEASESFWAGASKMFASQASGKVTLMLDGSNPAKPAYRPTSIFGKYELPNMGPKVTGISVIIAHALNKPRIETCNKGSPLDLEKQVKEAGLHYSCVDNPQVVLHLLCADNPTSRECDIAKGHIYGAQNPGQGKKQEISFNNLPDFFA